MIATTEDGTEVRASDHGAGPPVLVVPGGMDTGDGWALVTRRLTGYRTLRLHRRQYRLDLPRPATIAMEVTHVRAVAGELDRPLLVGHSSGAVVALEALVADPDAYSGAVLYEPPVVIGPPLGGAAVPRARAAIAAGRPAEALAIHLREVVRMSPFAARLIGWFLLLRPELKPLVERQIDDLEALDDLGVRLATYATIEAPVLLLDGSRSPDHLRERVAALAAVLPHPRRVTMPGQGHSANAWAPGRVARIIAEAAR